MSQDNFKSYSKYYDLLYREKNYQDEASYVSGLIKANNEAAHDLLEFGAGTGIHGRILGEQGFKVTGVELSPEMVAVSKPTRNFEILQGDMRYIDLGQQFDAVLSLFHVLSYQLTNRSVELVFKNAYKHLRDGGIFIFDIWYSPAVYKLRPEARVKIVESEELIINRLAEPKPIHNENRVDVAYTIFIQSKKNNEFEKIQETHSLRHFTLLELDLFAANSGFERVAAEEYLTSSIPSEDTWGVCLAYRKQV